MDRDNILELRKQRIGEWLSKTKKNEQRQKLQRELAELKRWIKKRREADLKQLSLFEEK